MSDGERRILKRAANSLAIAAQMDHCFQMEGVRKQVGQGDGVNCVPRCNEGAQVTSERGGVAGDVDERGRADLGEEGSDLRAEAGARRIHNDEIWNDEIWMLARLFVAEKIEGRGADGGSRCALEILFEGLDRGWSGFDGDDMGEAAGEAAGEEADAGEEVPGQRALLAGGDALHECVDEPAVDLEKGSVIDAIAETGRMVGDGGCAPVRYRLR